MIPWIMHSSLCIASMHILSKPLSVAAWWKLLMSLLWSYTQQAVQYLSLLQGVVLCAFGIQILSTARYTVIIALSLTSHHATPISVGTPVNTSGWISQEKHTHNYQDAQVKYQRYHCYFCYCSYCVPFWINCNHYATLTNLCLGPLLALFPCRLS